MGAPAPPYLTRSVTSPTFTWSRTNPSNTAPTLPGVTSIGLTFSYRYRWPGTAVVAAACGAVLLVPLSGVATAQAAPTITDQGATTVYYDGAQISGTLTSPDQWTIYDEATGNSTTGPSGTFTTAAPPTGAPSPIVPPGNPPGNGIYDNCGSDAECLADINGVRAAQENLPPITLPTNWASLTGAEQIFIVTDLEL